MAFRTILDDTSRLIAVHAAIHRRSRLNRSSIGSRIKPRQEFRKDGVKSKGIALRIRRRLDGVVRLRRRLLDKVVLVVAVLHRVLGTGLGLLGLPVLLLLMRVDLILLFDQMWKVVGLLGALVEGVLGFRVVVSVKRVDRAISD